MEKWSIALLLVFCMASVFAMDDAITVKTSGDYVKLYAWTAGTGPLLLMDEGAVANGTYTNTFYSLAVPTVKLQVIVTKNDEKIRENKFDNIKTSEPWLINCIPENCTISIFNDSAVEVIENEIIKNTPTENSSLITNAEISESKLIIIGKSIFINDDGTMKYNIIGGIVAAIILIILVMIFARKKKTIKEESPKEKNPEKDELEEIEEKIKKNENEIKVIKESELRKMRLNEAKKKLQEEEEQIKQLKERSPNNQNNSTQTNLDKASLNKPNPYAGNSTLKDRSDAQNNKHIKSFVDNMRKFAKTGDKQPGSL